MKYSESGFRPFYHRFCALKANKVLKEAIKDFPGAEEANAVLVYGFIGSEQKMLLEIVACAKRYKDEFKFAGCKGTPRRTFAATDLANVEAWGFEDPDKELEKRFAEKMEPLKQYAADAETEETRELGFLDDSRDPDYPDIVRVYLLKTGLEIEERRVRMTSAKDKQLRGVLLENTEQDFGVTSGAEILLIPQEDKENRKIVLLADMGIEKEDNSAYQDGSALRKALEAYRKEQNEETVSCLMRTLIRSNVLVPCDVELSDEARAIYERMDKEGITRDDLSVEEQQVLDDGTAILPLTAEGKEGNCVLAFSAEEEKQGKDIYVLTGEFRELAENVCANDDISEIVLNPFTDNIVLKQEVLQGLLNEKESDHDTEDPEAGNRINVNAQQTDDSGPVAIRVGDMSFFNFCLYQNGISPVRDVSILNRTSDTIEGLRLRITSDYHFFKLYDVELPPIPAGKPVRIDDPQLLIHGQMLAELNDARSAVVTVELLYDGETVAAVRSNMQILAYDQWMGTAYNYLLASFVMPNNPVIPPLMRETSSILKSWGKDPALDGYQSKDPNRVRELAAAAYAAIQKQNISYAEPPASYVIGQRIRTPEVVISQHLGTCMDMTLLYASLIEALGLHPILYMVDHHIFAGVWLKEKIYKKILIHNCEELTKRIISSTGEITFVECTQMCSGGCVPFEKAEKPADHKHLSKAEFDVAIDVASARKNYIIPMPSRTIEGNAFHIHVDDMGETQVTKAPILKNIIITEVGETEKKALTKKDIWEGKLLDLSPHNMLLSLPANASSLPVLSERVEKLEDALADGAEFHILPIPEWLKGICIRRVNETGQIIGEVPWVEEAIREKGIYGINNWPKDEDQGIFVGEQIQQDYYSHRLYTFINANQLEKELTEIYRTASACQQENGVNCLYLAIGMLRWIDTAEKTDENEGIDCEEKTKRRSKKSSICFAPLILYPVEIIRKSANQGYALHMRDEEPRFNATLLEMLRRKQDLEIGGLDPLPADEHGIDINKVFAIIRGAVRPIQGWDVVETCAVANFSFAQFALWNDIHQGGDMLEKSDIVRSLMKGYVDYDVTQPENLEAEKVYLPITVDGTQLKAIRMAGHGSTFVLHGPPGTGKSQTITGMIANLMAQGKTVLFVAEKMAALNVVQRRLTQLGIGDYCLELHSNKANKKNVLAQLEKALGSNRLKNNNEFSEYIEKTKSSRENLDIYSEHLHSKQPCGYSLFELIDSYEAVRGAGHAIRFDARAIQGITRKAMKEHSVMISQLTASGDTLDEEHKKLFRGIGLTEYTRTLRTELMRASDMYMKIAYELQYAGAAAAQLLGESAPNTKAGCRELAARIAAYESVKDGGDAGTVLKANIPAILAYMEQKQELDAAKEHLFETVRPGALQADLDGLMARHEAAGKKFFGRAGAMAAVTAEMQKYTAGMVSYEQIPGIVDEVRKYKDLEAAEQWARGRMPDDSLALMQRYPTAEELNAAQARAESYCREAAKFPGGLAAVQKLAADARTEDTFREFGQCWTEFLQEEERVSSLLQRSPADEQADLAEERETIMRIMRASAYLKDWVIYNRYRNACSEAGIGSVVADYEAGGDRSTMLERYRKGVYYALIEHIINTDEVIADFSGATFNESIQIFKRMDDILLEETKTEIYNHLARNIPTAFESPEIGREVSLLKKAIASSRGMSIRDLFQRLPHILPRLCPCMLMSPDSVAQYLERKNDMFDVVIFDEASQLPTCKAVGALARAKHAVIVGDPKQMPPTAFFAGNGPVVEDLALDDLDSILDDALALGIPSQHLQWHYRSTHESLIAFSNYAFYENKMFTFPSANDRERHVSAEKVDGVYSKSTNVIEAEAVVADVVRRFMDPALRGQSIGIVTFNIKQRDLIYNLLAKQFQVNAELDTWANSGDDPLFVKNLENVQGDERDVILFSIGYGPDEKGHISMSLGPINKTGGGKRLNVAFSRARVEMKIFTSMTSADIRLGDSASDGLRALRDFLRFAEGHELGEYAAAGGENGENEDRAGIQQRICEVLNGRGYETVTNIGHSSFRVDIAVIDPNNPNQYLMGIMLDGEGYRSTRNTRDREVAQFGVLRHLGWNLVRVWTVDWWDNREKEARRLLNMADKLKAASEARAEERRRKEAETAAKTAERTAEEERVRAQLAAQAKDVIAEDEEEEKREAEAEQNAKQEAEREAEKLLEMPEDGDGSSAENGTEPSDHETQAQNPEPHPETRDRNHSGYDYSRNVSRINLQERLEIPEVSETADSDTEREPTDPDITAGTAESTEKPETVVYAFTEYVVYSAEVEQLSSADFAAASHAKRIQEVMTAILEAEAPIQKDLLITRTYKAFGAGKTKAVLETIEKALKSIRPKNNRQNGIVFCWLRDQDPNNYRIVRGGESSKNSRAITDICQQEMKNAVCYVLQTSGSMDKAALLKETSKLLGYQRMTDAISDAIDAGIRYAKRMGAITTDSGGAFVLNHSSD